MEKSKVKLLAVICLVAFTSMASSCTNKKQDTASNQEAADLSNDKSDSTLNLEECAGTYEGTLPSADAAGTKIVLTLNADSTYSWTSDAMDKEKSHDEASGVYTVLDGNVLMLTRPSSGDRTFYKVKDSKSIIMTDSLGNEPEGETARFYILKKK